MRTRFTWILGVTLLISMAGALVACNAKYSSTNNGLVVVSTQGNAVMDTFSLNLNNGQITQVFNSAGPPTPGEPTTVVLNPGGTYAYVLVAQSVDVTASVTGIAIYQVASDGKLAQVGMPTVLNNTLINAGGQCESVAVSPVTLVMDSAGKFLFAANSAANGAPGSVSVFAVGSNGSLAEVNPVGCSSPGPGSPFPLPLEPGGTTPSASALAVTPTIYPPAYAVCSGHVPPATENLYVTDSANYYVLNYSVSSSGVLTLVPATSSTTPGLPTGEIPAGVTVDPCNRFVYVSNSLSNSVSAYKICNAISLPVCTVADFSLRNIAGSPFIAGTTPGPLLVDPLANFLYVLDQGQNAISGYKISTITGSLQPFLATTATNSFPTSMAIRSDDTWMFVTNLNQGNVSQYAITPATGSLTPQAPFQTDNNPWGVAVH